MIRELHIKYPRLFKLVIFFELLLILILTIAVFAPNGNVIIDGNMISYEQGYSGNGENLISIVNDTSLEQKVVASTRFALKSGKYNYHIEYSQENMSNDIMNSQIVLYSVEKESILRCGISTNSIYLFANDTENNGEIWVDDLIGFRDVELSVIFFGDGSLDIDSIIFTWDYTYSILSIVSLIFVLILLDYILALFILKDNETRFVIITLGFSIAFSSVLLIVHGIFWGDDIEFHVSRIASIAYAIKQGNWNMHIQHEMIDGYGYASPLFYGQFFLYFPALLHVAGMPLYACLKMYVLAINIATALIMFYSLNYVFKNKKISSVCTLFYMICSYRIINIYVRQAVGEYTAMVFLPMVIAGFVMLYRDKQSKISFLPLCFGLTGIIQSHILSVEMVGIFLIIAALLLWKETFTKRVLGQIGLAFITLILLNADFIVPFISSYRMDLLVKSVVPPIERKGVSPNNIFRLIFTDGAIESADGMLYYSKYVLGLAFLVVILAYFCCIIFKFVIKNSIGNDDTSKFDFRMSFVCFVLICISAYMSTDVFPWLYVKDIPFIGKFLVVVQFPWRYFEIASALGTFLLGFVLKQFEDISKKKIAIVVCCLCVSLNAIGGAAFYIDFAKEIKTVKLCNIIDLGNENIGSAEYLLLGCARNPNDAVVYDTNSVVISDYKSEYGRWELEVQNNSDEEQFFVLPVNGYDNFVARDMNSHEKLEVGRSSNMLISVGLKPKYSGRVEVYYQVPWYWNLATFFNAAAWLVVAMYFIYRISLKRRALTSKQILD